MKTGFSRLVGVLLGVVLMSALPGQVAHADLAPPVPLLALSLGAMVALGMCVVMVVLVSFLAIWAIKKNRTKDEA
jgi:hypothetical protein